MRGDPVPESIERVLCQVYAELSRHFYRKARNVPKQGRRLLQAVPGRIRKSVGLRSMEERRPGAPICGGICFGSSVVETPRTIPIRRSTWTRVTTLAGLFRASVDCPRLWWALPMGT
jgi:hypothetical protein